MQEDDDQRGLVGWIVGLGALTAIGIALALALSSAMGGFGSGSGSGSGSGTTGSQHSAAGSAAQGASTGTSAGTSAGTAPGGANQAGASQATAAGAAAGTAVASLPVLAKLYFATDVAAVSDEGQGALRAAIAAAKAHPASKLAVSGFHDKTGNADQNHELAKQRATTVRDALVAAGIDVARIDLRKPEVTEGGADDREARRVEVRVE
jgi:outer membrane protein OmpA-like peptidoglycan-associated protein